MAGSVHDQAHLAGLFDAGEVNRLFSATAEIRAMMVVEGALANVQGAANVIPELSAEAIHRASLELQIDPGGLARETARNGVSVPALVAAFRELMQAPEHAQFVHWGATSQDIIDTALMLRLRQAVTVIGKDLDAALGALANLADAHADTPMVARTYGQQAAPTSFGAVVASWGQPLLNARKALTTLTFPVSLSGAVGTGSALGDDPAAIRAGLADALKLNDLGRSWHTDRSPVLDIARASAACVSALAKFGEDLISHCQTDLAEIQLGGGGSSSTMPQKQNPVAPSVLVAIAHVMPGFMASLDAAAVHRFQRDGAAWFAEWMVLPQILLATASAAGNAKSLAESLTPDTDRMAQALAGDGLLMAETLSFALARIMPRPEAQAAVKELAQEVRTTRRSLSELARERWPDLPETTFAPICQLGAAPSEARSFAKAVRES